MKKVLLTKGNKPVKGPEEEGHEIEGKRDVRAGINLHINSDSIAMGLMAAVFLLVTLSIIGTVIRHNTGSTLAYYFFNLDTEANAPSFFSTMILLLSGFLFLVISFHKKGVKDSFTLHWFILSFGFFFLALDESISIHEKLIEPLREIFNLSGFFYYSWVVVGGVVLITFLISYYKFFFSLSTEFRWKFFTAGTVYVCGVIGMEMVGGYYTDTFGKDVTYEFVYALEETLEMTGIIFLIRTLFSYIAKFVGSTKLVFK